MALLTCELPLFSSFFVSSWLLFRVSPLPPRSFSSFIFADWCVISLIFIVLSPCCLSSYTFFSFHDNLQRIKCNFISLHCFYIMKQIICLQMVNEYKNKLQLTIFLLKLQCHYSQNDRGCVPVYFSC